MAYKYDEHGNVIDFTIGDWALGKVAAMQDRNDCAVCWQTKPVLGEDGNPVEDRTHWTVTFTGTLPGVSYDVKP